MSELKAMMDAMPLPDGEPIVGKTLRADGWVYRDLPRLHPKLFEEFVAIVGPENIEWLTQATYGDGSKRGQLMVSPNGIDRIKSRAAEKDKG